MDFLYCCGTMEKDDSQVRVAFKERIESRVSETEMIQLNTQLDADQERGGLNSLCIQTQRENEKKL